MEYHYTPDTDLGELKLAVEGLEDGKYQFTVESRRNFWGKFPLISRDQIVPTIVINRIYGKEKATITGPISSIERRTQ